MADGTVVVRKPRKTGLAKMWKKFSSKVFVYGLPIARYSIIPGMLLYAMYFTEPNPTLFELLNPFV